MRPLRPGRLPLQLVPYPAATWLPLTPPPKPGATIYCFEPQPRQFQALSRWAASRGTRVKCYGFALGEKPGPATLHSFPAMPRHASLRPSTSAWQLQYASGRTLHVVPTPVEVFRLDDLALGLSLADEILVKIDTEGFEGEVIRGGMAVLSRSAACIVEVSLESRFEGQTSFRDLVDLLSEAGLHYVGNLHHCVVAGALRYFDALFVRNDDRG